MVEYLRRYTYVIQSNTMMKEATPLPVPGTRGRKKTQTPNTKKYRKNRKIIKPLENHIRKSFHQPRYPNQR